MRLVRRVLTGIVLAVLLWCGAGLAGGLWRSAGESPGQGAGVWLMMGPIHTDILFPIDDTLRSELRPLGIAVDHPLAEWVAVGWGSRAFYTSAGSYLDLSAGAVWTAATGDSAVLRFDVLGAVAPGPNLKWMEMSPAQLLRLRDAVLADRAGTAALDAHLSPTDAFVPARGRFNLFRTCNVWVGQKMRSAGLSFGRWTVFTWSVALSA